MPSGSSDAPVILPAELAPESPYFEPAPFTPEEGQPRVVYVYLNGRSAQQARQPGRKRGSKWIYELTTGPCGECPECTRRLQVGMVLRSKACLEPRDRATEGCRPRPVPKAKAKAKAKTKAKAKAKAKSSSSASSRP